MPVLVGLGGSGTLIEICNKKSLVVLLEGTHWWLERLSKKDKWILNSDC